jgi:hypothetical protein
MMASPPKTFKGKYLSSLQQLIFVSSTLWKTLNPFSGNHITFIGEVILNQVESGLVSDIYLSL